MDTTNLVAPPSAAPISRADADRLKRKFRGHLILPDDTGYAEARRVWNGMVDKRPALIAYCTSAEDVVAAIEFARARGLRPAVRSGGHNVAGACLCNGGLVIDLSRMKRIEIDPVRRLARAEAGLTLGEFDAATQGHGLATTMGVNSDTGIAGLTLGGGIGKLGRNFGLSCDNLVSAEIVTADGRLLTASEAENADLFWGLRGGGGNFGIVTAFEYRLHPVGPNLLAGSVVYDYAQARDALRFLAVFAREAPDALSLDAALVTAPSGACVFSISACYAGPIEEGERAVEPLRTFGRPVEDRIAPIPYLQIQAAGDPIFPRGRRFYWKAQFLRELTDGAIDAMLAAFRGAPSASSLLVLQHVGGAIARVPQTATPYVNRDALYDCFPISIWDDPAADEANIRWARRLWDAIRPFSTGGVYANNLGDEGEDRVKSAYGANYPRLAALKARYDPENFFRMNQNVRPAQPCE
ncbi:MAG TPA: FAD-binding oxidoreductase [Stellaceae bacterium]|nr:FAD-binding oxidoreductase [Stellaceae bacterium]